jgi:hypothetical protein
MILPLVLARAGATARAARNHRVRFCKLYAEGVLRFLTKVNLLRAAQQQGCRWRANALRDARAGLTIA